jgi:hypothetical protein
MLAIPPFVQHSSSLSLSPRSCFRTHFLIHSRLGLVFKVFFSLLFFFLSTHTYLTLMLHFLFVGLCYLAFRLLPSAGLCRRFSLRLPDSAAASAPPSLPYLAYLATSGSVPPPHAVTAGAMPMVPAPSLLMTHVPHDEAKSSSLSSHATTTTCLKLP